MAITRKSQSPVKEYKMVLAVLASPIPGYTNSAKALCTQAEMTTPAITSYDMFRQVVQSRPRESIQGQVYYGQDCASPAIATYKVKKLFHFTSLLLLFFKFKNNQGVV